MSIAIKKILVAYDGFDRNEALPALASVLALEHDAQLHLIHVAPKVPHRVWGLGSVSATDLYDALVEQRRDHLELLAAETRKKGIDSHVVIRSGKPHIEIIQEALAIEADLLILTDEPLRKGKRGFGSVTTSLLRECPCPVLAKRDHRKFKHSKIVAAVDVQPSPANETPANRRIIDLAATLARASGGQLQVFHSWMLWGEQLLRSRNRSTDAEIQELLNQERQGHEQELDSLLADCELEGVEAEAVLVKGDVRKQLPQFVLDNKVDIVVMGTVSRTGLQRLIMGNTAEKILGELSCSVLAVKPEGFISPVAAD